MPAYLLDAPDVGAKDLPRAIRDYVEWGEEKDLHTGYKCSIRKNWYRVPSTHVSDAFMLRQVHAFPRLILNSAGATCTDTIHRLRIKEGVHSRHVIVAFMNSMTLAFSEITGRSYGGGVMTFEPSEAERLPLPMKGVQDLDFDELDRLYRLGKTAAILDAVDQAVLRRGLGLQNKDIAALRQIWVKLRDRRILRKHVVT